ncbi:hypothetical protein H6758_00660 [Candidatus Nomurabacteria bacterium]|nr:hypothetical protein [Candidatus Nomurabacteria bacterium]
MPLFHQERYSQYTFYAGATVALLHLFFASSLHWNVRPMAMLFIFVGAAQLIWGHFFHEKQSHPMFWLGMILHGGVAVTWYMTRIWNAPYVGQPLPFGLLDAVIGLLEVLVVIFAVEAFYKQSHIQWLPVWTVLLCLVSGIAMYWGGFVVEYIWPTLV